MAASTAWVTSSGPRAATRSLSVPPSTSSMAITGTPSISSVP
jgi:hypothetical protein